MRIFTLSLLAFLSQPLFCQVLWQDDFSNPSNWVIDHDGTFDSDWEIGVGLESTGQFGTPAIASTTADNGYALYNSDSFNNQSANYEQAHITTFSPANLTGFNNVILEFETQYRRFTDEQAFLIVSTNGTFPVLDDPFMDISTLPGVYRVWEQGELTQDVSPGNPTTRSFDISDIAGGQAQVWVRLQFTGIWGYAWYVDDIKISVQNDYDVALSLPYVSQFGDGVEYGSVPQSQLNGDMYVGVAAINEGTQMLTNVAVNVFCINQNDGLEYFNETAFIGDLLSGEGQFADLVPAISTLPIGNYIVYYSVSSGQDSFESDFFDNYQTRYFSVTDGYYAIDAVGSVPAGTEILAAGIGTNSFTDNPDDLVLMNYYMINQTLNVNGIQVLINTNTTIAGSQLLPAVFDTSDVFADNVTAPMFLGNLYTVTAADIANGYVYLPFDGAITLAPNAYYVGVALYSGGNTSDIRVLDDITVEQPDFASMINLPSDGITYTNGNAFAIELLTQPPSSECSSLSLTFDQGLCFDEGSGTGVYGPLVSLIFNYTGDCTVSFVTIDGDTPIDVTQFNLSNDSIISAGIVNAGTSSTFSFTLNDGTVSADFTVDANDCSGDPTVCDCAGNELSIGVTSWIGDTYADSGLYTWGGQLVDFNCATWGYDCGDITGAPSEDPYDVCGGGLPPAADPFGATGFGCVIGTSGCTDIFACNYDPTATVDDGSCSFPGCTDFFACNYDFTAGCDDFSCTYGGCTDPTAYNYDVFAACDDGSCVYLTCDPYSLGFNQTPCIDAGDGTGVLYPQGYFTFEYSGDCTVSQLILNDGTQDIVLDVTAPDNVSGSQFYVYAFDPSVIYDVYYTLSDGTASPLFSLEVNDCTADAVICDCVGNQHTIGVLAWLGDGGLDDGSYSWGGVPVYLNCDTWGNDCGDDPFAISDPNGVCLGNIPFNNGCDFNEILGCTDINAANYNPVATINDGSCIYEVSGCTNPYADNYDAFATLDDGTCAYSDFVCDCAGNQHTIGVLFWHGDGFADDGSYTWDNLPVYFDCAIWGYDCGDIVGAPGDDPYGTCLGILPPNNGCVFEIAGCTDVNACNYNFNATLDDGSCVFPGCTDPNAENYDPAAGCNNNTCIYGVPCTPLFLAFDQAPCVSDNDVLYPSGFFTFYYDGDCSVQTLTIISDTSVFNFDIVAPNNLNGSQFELYGFDPTLAYTAYFTLSDGTSSDVFDITTTDCSGDPLICDCIGNQHTIGVLDWLGDTYADDGAYTWAGQSVNFDCATWGYDCGDVVGAPVEDPFLVCEGNIPPNNGCASNVILGCTDSVALNYNILATLNDGSCIYVTAGCTDPFAVNYNPLATENDGSCVYSSVGCTILSACNYNPEATVNDGSCGPAVGSACNDGNASTINDVINNDCVCVGVNNPNSGCTDILACNYEATATINDGSCSYPGCVDVTACNYNPLAGCPDASCISSGCTDVTACNFEPNAGCDNGSCIDAGPYLDCEGNCFNDADLDGICDEFEAAGCSDPLACNYTPNDLDPSNDICVFPGCTNTLACNYDSDAGCNDGSCSLPGCTNPSACNYDITAGCEDGTCLFSGIAPNIIGPTTVEVFGTSLYSVPLVAGASYIWTVTGGNIISGGATNSVEIQWGIEGSQALSVSIDGGNGCISTALYAVLVTPQLAITNLSPTGSIDLYPNPSNHLLNLKANGLRPERIEILNLLGEQLYSGTFKSQLDVSRFSNGMYVLRIWSNGMAQTRRFEVQH